MTTPVALAPRLLPATGDPRLLTAAQRARRAEFPVALVSMPWAWPQPQLAIGLLTAIGRSHGFPVESHHLSVDLVSVVPLRAQIEVHDHDGVGEWLFSAAAFGDRAGGGDQLAALSGKDRRRLAAQGLGPDRLARLREHDLPAWICRVARATDWGRYRVVGFSSSFAQNAASLALANEIKQQWPHVVIVFGGANMERPMGEAWLRGMATIDLVVSGEADQVFPTLLVALSEGRDPALLPGVLRRGPDGAVVDGGVAPPFAALDSLPVPNYDDFFHRLPRAGLSRSDLPASVIQFEASRGCWWGERRHCTFCGLNGTTMAYRAKSPERVLAELDQLAGQYATRRFAATDNILGSEHVAGVLDPLAARGAPYKLFFEVKANIDRHQVRRLRRAGVRAMQPGIESLHSRVLGLMRKGVRASTNVNLLRWCVHYGIRAHWNLLWGFPGERPGDVAEQAALLADLVHLTPPLGRGRIRIERFSPLFNARDDLPIHGFRAAEWYRRAFPATIDLDQAAYMFDGDIEGALPDAAYLELEAAVDAWVERWTRGPVPSLLVRFSGNEAEVVDTRRGDERVIRLDPAATAAYRACFDAPAKAREVVAAAAAAGAGMRADAALTTLERHGLVMHDGGLLLGLALPDARARHVRGRAPTFRLAGDRR